LDRCIGSVLAQDFPDFELVVVDDGSTDETPELLSRYDDTRVRLVRHERNRGVTAAKNTALGEIRGEWFSFLDSDDELVPHALSTLLAVPDRLDPKVDALSANCVDSTTGAWSGTGLDRDQYVSFEDVLGRMKGEYWGLTKTSLLAGRRFNERIAGAEGIVWFPISERATRYYVHRALRIYHTEGKDRVSKRNATAAAFKRREHFIALEQEREYLEALERWRPEQYAVIQSNIAMVHVLDGHLDRARVAHRALAKHATAPRRWLVGAAILLGPSFVTWVYRIASRVR
jgi:GalNAc5-diNAcBac-PP-undecaprenol beta-1,3-glucosyltransferase